MKKDRKKDKKPLYMLLCLFIIFCGFIYLITWRPPIDPLSESIEYSQTSDDVKEVWNKIKAEKLPEEKKKKLLQDIRNKLTDLNLSQKEIDEWIKELAPYTSINLNIIIIPDLSARISNNPYQINNDLQIINEIWNVFKGYSRLKQNNKSRLVIEVADDNPRIADIINQLRFDLSTHKGAGVHFFTDEKDNIFEDNVKKLYESAQKEPFVSDYVFYFKQRLNNHLRKSTLFDIYINKIIVITNGYIKGIDNRVYTVIDSHRFQLYLAMRAGNLLETIYDHYLNIPPADIDLSYTDILVCEVDEMDSGRGYDFEILKTYWEDWLNNMNTRNIIFSPKRNAILDTNNNVKDFILQKQF